MTKLKVGELVFDFSLYPRIDVDSQHLTYVKEAITAGVVMPPPVVDALSKRLADGFHRTRAYLALYGPDHEIDVIQKNYRDEGEIFADAIRLNANHGRTLSRFDRVHCVILADKFNMDPADVASAMGMTVDRLTELRQGRTATVMTPGKRAEATPIKNTIRHMAGKPMTPQQVEANGKLSGMNQMFYVNQIVTLIENDLIDAANDDLMARLRHLGALIAGLDGKPRLTITDAIRMAVNESPRTNAEVFDRVAQLVPDASKATVDSTLSALQKRGEIAKGDDLKWKTVGLSSRKAS